MPDEREDQGDDALFRDAMEGVQPVAEGPRTVENRRRPKARPRLDRPRLPRFSVRPSGQAIEGLAEGVGLKALRDLRKERPRLEVDLHGMTAQVAREVALDALERARRNGERRVLIIHGRGLRSAAGPVLKRAVVDWLVGEPAARWVRAFCSAPPEWGGVGATLVLLRASSR